MLILDLVEHETIWGGERLSQNPGSGKKIGHLYSLITESEMASRIVNGPHAGETFRDYFESNKAELGMARYDEFPFVVALVEAGDNLSVQVHPGDEAAQELEGWRYGKNESWFFLEPPEEGWIYNGCICKSRDELRGMLDAGELDKITDVLPIKAGDYTYIEAGTLHALSRGSVVYEIEENCNLTYRFFDFNRKDKNGCLRELHIEKAFQSIDIRKKSSVKAYPNDTPIVERRYSTQLLENLTEYQNAGEELACFTLIDGHFHVDNTNVMPGMSILLLPGERIACHVKTAIVARPRSI